MGVIGAHMEGAPASGGRPSCLIDLPVGGKRIVLPLPPRHPNTHLHIDKTGSAPPLTNTPAISLRAISQRSSRPRVPRPVRVTPQNFPSMILRWPRRALG